MYLSRIRPRTASQGIFWGVAFLLAFLACPLHAQGNLPVLLFSDLDSGPSTGGQNGGGAFVTVWGNNFGATRGTGFVTVGSKPAVRYPHWSDTKIVFQLSAGSQTGEITVTNSNGEISNPLKFSVRPGRIFFVSPNGTGDGSFSSPMSPITAYEEIRAGDTFYFRSGTYSAKFGDLNWSRSNYSLGKGKRGTAQKPVAFVGYPNERAVFEAPGGGDNFNLRDSSNMAAGHITIANLVLIGGYGCISGGGVTVAYGELEKSGAAGVRIVGNTLSATYSGNTQTALLTISNDRARVYGNEFRDTGTTPPISQNHAIYVNLGASDIAIGWNTFHDLRMGHVIQVHTDTYFLYTDIRIHDNLIWGASPGDSRGINVGNVRPGTYGVIYNNVLHNLGQNFSAIALHGGDWKVYNNTLYNIGASAGMIWLNGQWGGRPTADVQNNILYSDGVSPYVSVLGGLQASHLSLSNNLYFNHGPAPQGDAAAVEADPKFLEPKAGNFHLNAGSPAIDCGKSAASAVVPYDRDGVRRPRGRAIDIGAYEALSDGGASPRDERCPKASGRSRPTHKPPRD